MIAVCGVFAESGLPTALLSCASSPAASATLLPFRSRREGFCVAGACRDSGQ
jgi:hypothetical protein